MSRCRDPRTKQFVRCASGLRNDPDDPIFPPGLDWKQVRRQFSIAHDKWYAGLREYSDVMSRIEGYAKLAGPEYREVARLAKRGRTTAGRLMEQQRIIQDDLYVMSDAMPRRG